MLAKARPGLEPKLRDKLGLTWKEALKVFEKVNSLAKLEELIAHPVEKLEGWLLEAKKELDGGESVEKLGAKLGPVRQIRTAQSPHQPPPRAMMMRAEMASDGGNQEMGMATGLIRFATQVHVEFDLIAP